MAETPSDVTFDARSFFNAIQILGELPVTDDLQGITALTILRRQFTELVSGHAQSGYTLVYRPGEPNPSGNIFADWNELIAAYNTFRGPMIIFFDDSLVSPAVVPAGIYTFRVGTIFSGLINRFGSAAGAVFVEFEDGTQLDGVNYFQNALTMLVHGVAAPLFIPVAAGLTGLVVLEKGANFQTITAGGRVFDVPDGAFQIIALFNSTLLQGASEVVRGLGPACIIAPVYLVQGEIQTDTIAGDGTLFNIIESPAAIISPTQTNFIGVSGSQINNTAFLLGYSPTNIADWSGVDPGNVGEALDRIAAVLSPIP